MAKSLLMEEVADDCNSDKGCKCDKETIDQTREYRLGGDDPFWPHYLKEAENYDDIMVDKWEKKMDTLLLFATLFSAIVTAFVTESSKNLQPDSAAITAAAIIEIAGILRNRSANDQQNPTFQSPDDFQPTRSAFFVNFVWFVSLCLSLTVALLAGLAKQWSNSLRWDRTAPPCTQARIRQARLNKLIRGRTGLVISAIRVIMDAALGFFLIGLLAFLHDLNQDIYIAALVVITITGIFYFGTTLAPCFVSFSPYETPVSSRKAWAFFCQLWLALNNWIIWILRRSPGNNAVKVRANFKKLLSSCEKMEKEVASKTTPDELTGDALSWIILHSQSTEPREIAIRAIATLDSEVALQQLGSPDILPKVIQSFTSCFIVRSTKDGKTELEIRESIGVHVASLHGRALTMLITQSLHPGNNEKVRFAESGWVVDPTTKRGVMDRFSLGHLADCEVHQNKDPSPEANSKNSIDDLYSETKPTTSTKTIRAPDHFHGDEGNLAPITPWEHFPGDPSLSSLSTRSIRSDEKQTSSNHGQSLTGSRIPAYNSPILPNDSEPSNGETIMAVQKEPADDWSKSPNIKSNTRNSTRLLKSNTKNNCDSEARVWALVGLSAWYDFIEYDKGLRFNQGQAIRDLTKSLKWSLPPSLCKEVLCTLIKEISYWAPTISAKNRKETLQHLIELIPKTPIELQSQFACTLAALVLNLNHSTSYLAPLSSNPPGGPPEEEYNNSAASLLINHYANKPGQLARDGRSLLLFSLTGLMEYYEHCDFDEEAHNNMKQIAQQFQELDDIGKLQSIDIPATIATTRGTETKFIDTRDYYVSTLLLYLKLPRTREHSQHMDEVFTYLLKSINRKRQSRELIQYGPQIIPTVAQVLSQTDDAELKSECLKTMVSYWDSGSSLLYVQILLFYEVPAKVVHLIETQLAKKSDKKKHNGKKEGTLQPSEPSTSILLAAASVVFSKMGEQVQSFTAADSTRLVSCMRDIMTNDLLWVLLDILDLHDKIKATRPTPASPEGQYAAVTLQDVHDYLKTEGVSLVSGESRLLSKMVDEYGEERNKNLAQDVLQRWPRRTGRTAPETNPRFSDQS